MPPNDPAVGTACPLWLVWLGHILLYMALLAVPAALAAWLAAQAPTSLASVAKDAATWGLLPLLYGGLYWLLRRWRARAQNFVWLVVSAFAYFGWSQWRAATAEGGWSDWLGAGFCALHTFGFVTLAVWGWGRSRAERRASAEVARQTRIDEHAATLPRAREWAEQKPLVTVTRQVEPEHGVESDRAG